MISCVEKESVGVIQVNEALTAATVDAFREELMDWQAEHTALKNYLVDLSQVDFLDSAGLGTLMATLKRVSEGGGDLKVCGLQEKPRLVFEITRAYKVFEIFDSESEALASF